MQKQTVTKYASLMVAAMTFVSVAVHDTKIDKMTTIAIALPVLAVYESAHLLMSTDGSHTHVEKVSVLKTALKNTSLLPQRQTRQNEDKGYRLGRGVPKGHHPFDNYNLPVVA